MDAKQIDLVTPVCNEEKALEPFIDAVERDLIQAEPNYRFSVVLVEDGSEDDSWDVIQRLSRRLPWVKGVRLSRNFGAHHALTAGILESKADATIALACDLQDPPIVCREFLRAWEGGKKLVWGERTRRADSLPRIWGSALFFVVAKRLMPRGSRFTTGSFFLADRCVRECYERFGESRRLTFALMAWTGFEQARVPYERPRRAIGQSSWTYSRMVGALWDTVLAYSDWPARAMTWLGAVMLAGSLGLLGWSLAMQPVGRPEQLWAGLATLLCGFQGLTCILLGVLAHYLTRVYQEVARRPLYFVSDRTERPG